MSGSTDGISGKKLASSNVCCQQCSRDFHMQKNILKCLQQALIVA